MEFANPMLIANTVMCALFAVLSTQFVRSGNGGIPMLDSFLNKLPVKTIGILALVLWILIVLLNGYVLFAAHKTTGNAATFFEITFPGVTIAFFGAYWVYIFSQAKPKSKSALSTDADVWTKAPPVRHAENYLSFVSFAIGAAVSKYLRDGLKLLTKYENTDGYKLGRDSLYGRTTGTAMTSLPADVAQNM